MCTCTGCIGEGIIESGSGIVVNFDDVISWVQIRIENEGNQEIKNHWEKLLERWTTEVPPVELEQLIPRDNESP